MNRLVCPRHAIPLVALAAGSAELHQCPSCRGLWLRKEDLDGILKGQIEEWRLPMEAEEGAVEGDSLEEGAAHCSCPGSPLMRSVKRRGVVVDHCTGCGAVWLDGGELSQLLEHGREESPPSDPDSHRRGDAKTEVGQFLLDTLIGFFH